MTKEEELQFLKGLVVENLEKSRKRALRSSIALMAMVLLSAASMTYTYIQQTRVVSSQNLLITCVEEAQRQTILADLNAKKAIDVKNEAESQQASAAEALKKCEESKKK